jgi:hypothetical protein
MNKVMWVATHGDLPPDIVNGVRAAELAVIDGSQATG